MVQLMDRAGKQCRERYHNYPDTNIIKEKWTHEEGRNLMHVVVLGAWQEVVTDSL